MRHELARQQLDAGNRHEQHQGSAGRRQRSPVEIVVVAGQHGDLAGDAAVRDRDPGCGRDGVAGPPGTTSQVTPA